MELIDGNQIAADIARVPDRGKTMSFTSDHDLPASSLHLST